MFTNSEIVTSGPPCLAVINRNEASETPSMGERPMIGFSMFGQKFIIRKVRITNPIKGDNLWIGTREYSINPDPTLIGAGNRPG
jgi:hypothetical protein